jgi:hypothetical protein
VILHRAGCPSPAYKWKSSKQRPVVQTIRLLKTDQAFAVISRPKNQFDTLVQPRVPALGIQGQRYIEAL